MSEGGRPDEARRLTDPFAADLTDDTWLETLRRAEAPPKPGRLGEYEVLAELGRGGQGVVYRARQPRTGRTVALKCLPGWRIAGALARARFEREIEAACKLSHPGIVTVHGVDVLDDQPVLTMEWVEGESIDRWAARRGPDSLREVLEVFRQACDAVAHAHRRGVIHRDLKPSNVLVDGQGRARVLDFGLAKLTDAGAAATGTVTGFVGTPVYASPEQIDGRSAEADTRTDVYALGVILYQLAAGAAPFGGATIAEVFDHVRRGPDRPPSAARRGVPRDLDWIVLKAMAIEPHRRYGTVDALAEDVRRLMAGEPLEARGPGSWYRLRRAVGRRPATFAAAAVAVIGLVVLTAVSGALALQLAGRSRDLAGALGQAQDARGRAEASAKANAQGVALLRDLIESVQAAAQSRSKQDPVRAVLRRMCDRLEAGELGDDAAGRLLLWTTLAELASRGLYHPELERCVAVGRPLSEALNGAESADTAQWLVYAGLAQESRQNMPQAAQLYKQARSILERAGATGTETYARATFDLGAAMVNFPEELQNVGPLYIEALRVRTAVYGDPSPPVARVLGGLADLMRRLRRFDDADTYLKRAQTAAEAACDPLDSRRLYVTLVKGRIQQDRGDVAAAEATWRAMLADLEARVASDSPLLGLPLRPLTQFAADQGRYEEAADLGARLAATMDESPDAFRSVRLNIQRADWLTKLGRKAEAEALLTDAVALAPLLVPPNPKLVLQAQAALEALRSERPR